MYPTIYTQSRMWLQEAQTQTCMLLLSDIPKPSLPNSIQLPLKSLQGKQAPSPWPHATSFYKLNIPALLSCWKPDLGWLIKRPHEISITLKEKKKTKQSELCWSSKKTSAEKPSRKPPSLWGVRWLGFGSPARVSPWNFGWDNRFITAGAVITDVPLHLDKLTDCPSLVSIPLQRPVSWSNIWDFLSCFPNDVVFQEPPY